MIYILTTEEKFYKLVSFAASLDLQIVHFVSELREGTFCIKSNAIYAYLYDKQDIEVNKPSWVNVKEYITN